MGARGQEGVGENRWVISTSVGMQPAMARYYMVSYNFSDGTYRVTYHGTFPDSSRDQNVMSDTVSEICGIVQFMSDMLAETGPNFGQDVRNRA